MTELDSQYSCLESIETEITADDFIEILVLGAVDSQKLQLLGHLFIVCQDHPAIAEGAEVF